MHYESFKPGKKNAEKPRSTFLQRFISKLNNQSTGKSNEVHEDIEYMNGNDNVKDSIEPDLERKHKSVAEIKLDVGQECKPNVELKKSLPVVKRYSESVIQDRLTITRLLKSVKTNLTSTIRESSNLSTIQRVDRGYWMPDSICHKCYNCEDEFTTIKRKHHCRMCGQIFCYYCCTFELPGSLWNLAKPQRSCRYCFLSYYSHSDSKQISPRNNGSYRNSSFNSRHNKLNISPRGSIVSETQDNSESNLSSSKRNLSFSSNDIYYLSQHNTQPISKSNDESSESETGNDFDQLNEVKMSNIPDTEDLIHDYKKDRKISIHKAYYKYFFPTGIVSKEKLFGNRTHLIAESAHRQNITVTSSSYKHELLLIWKLIINETEKNRKRYFTKDRMLKEKRKSEHRSPFFNNDDEEHMKNGMPIIVTGANSSKSCIHGNLLIDWIIRSTEVDYRSRAMAICQSYLEMQLLTTFFDLDDKTIFKDDETLYVIREFLSDYSPRPDSQISFFGDTELNSLTGDTNALKTFGNSTFFTDDDLTDPKVETSQQSSSIIKSPDVIRPFFGISNYENDLEESLYQKVNAHLWNRSCRYLERLLKQELHDYNIDISWCNIILPICKLVSEKIDPSNIGDTVINDIRSFIQVKKIPNSSKNDCRVFHSVSMSKNVDFPFKKEIRNPNVMLIRSSIDYWRHRKLVSFEPLLLQEEEYLKNCVIKIKNMGPDIVVVEGSVSLIAKDMMEKCGLVLISNIRKEQMERLSRMLGTVIFDSVDSLGGNVESVIGKCSQFSIQKYTLINGRNKHLLLFKLCNPKHGCTLTLHGKSLSELVRVKYVIKFLLGAFKNAYFELGFLMNFHIRPFPTSNNLTSKMDEKISYSDEDQNESSSTFLDIIENRCITLSVNVHYNPPAAVLRSISNPELQSRLLSLSVINLSWKERLKAVLKRKQRHICAELYDVARMDTRKHPLMCEPELHVFTNSFYNKDLNNKEQCILYSDFRTNGSRFHPVNKEFDSSIISTVNFEDSDLACKIGFLTKSQEIKWRNMEKKKFESITDSFNPRNYQRILLLYSIQTRMGICEKPRKISLNYYQNTDRTLGNFVSSMLNETITCPSKCELSILEHVYKFVSNDGCIQVSLHQLEVESHLKLFKSLSTDDDASTIKLWSWCSRCDKHLPLQHMTDETCNLSLGRFFDFLFNLNIYDMTLFPGQCLHSLQGDIHYYFTKQSINRALEIKYSPIIVHEFQTPDLFISYAPIQRSAESLVETFKALQSDISKVTDIKTRYNLDIKEKLCKLKSISKEKDNELWDFLKQDSNSEQYSRKMQEIHNLMEEIYSRSLDKFDTHLFIKNENYIKDEIVHLWADVVSIVTRWDAKLNEAFDKEEKNEKRTFKESKSSKISSEDLQIEQDFSKACPQIKVDKVLAGSRESLANSSHLSITVIPENIEKKVALQLENSDDTKYVKADSQNLEIALQSQRRGSITSYENINEAEINLKKEKSSTLRESDPKVLPQIERISNTGTNAMQPLRKLFSGLFNSNGYKILDDPIAGNVSYSFANVEAIRVPIAVKDDFITSVVAFALSSDLYLEMLADFSVLSKDNDKFEMIPRFCVTDRQYSPELTNIENLSSPNGSPGLKNERRPIKVEPTRDRELSVRYFPHAESDELFDIYDQNSTCGDPKQETDDIKIEVSSEENMTEDTSQRIFTTSKQSIKTSQDFILNLNNNKVKCTCKIYYAKRFHDLRQQIFKNDDKSYIRSLSECKSWVTTGGKSGLKFRKTLDDRFIIKQLHMIELEGFKKFHGKYFDYISERISSNEKCVLAKILGLYHVDYYNSITKVTEKMEFLVMENVFHNQKPSRIFDLKGNKQGGANIITEKVNSDKVNSDNSVMQDKDFINNYRLNPFYVSWQAQIALKETLTRDTDFLQSLPVMDYSLLVGVDDDNQILVIGIIDYLRMFTTNKLIEMHIKQKLLTPHGELPTVIQPQKYQKRFLEAMEEYFLVCPIPWDHLLLYPFNSNSDSIHNKKQNFSFKFSSIYPSKIRKVSLPKRNREKSFDGNEFRSGFLTTL